MCIVDFVANPKPHAERFLHKVQTLPNKSFPSTFKDCVRNLGVLLDPSLSLDTHAKQVVQSYVCHLRHLVKLKPILRMVHLHSFIHAFVISRWDFSNSLLAGVLAIDHCMPAACPKCSSSLSDGHMQT